MDDVVEKKYFSIYSRICVHWRPFPPIPIEIEIISPEGIWKQKIENEEVVENCKRPKSTKHFIEDCVAHEKGKELE